MPASQWAWWWTCLLKTNSVGGHHKECMTMTAGNRSYKSPGVWVTWNNLAVSTKLWALVLYKITYLPLSNSSFNARLIISKSIVLTVLLKKLSWSLTAWNELDSLVCLLKALNNLCTFPVLISHCSLFTQLCKYVLNISPLLYFCSECFYYLDSFLSL